MKHGVRELNVNRISPNLFSIHDLETVEEMMLSIRHRGQLEPIRVMFAGDSFRILDGEKRWKACKKLGMTNIRAVIVESEPEGIDF
jgi:ParB family chromosome partitioning protein